MPRLKRIKNKIANLGGAVRNRKGKTGKAVNKSIRQTRKG